MKTKIAALSFLFTLLIASFFAISQINQAKEKKVLEQRQALLQKETNPQVLRPNSLP